MQNLRPAVFLIASFIFLWIGIFIGSRIREAYSKEIEGEGKMIAVLEGALLTFFGLLMGFVLSMAVSRYDIRKDLIVKEANAIGTTWLRSEALEDPVRTQTQQLLRQYISTRREFLTSGHNQQEFQQSLVGTSQLQDRLWSIASNYAVGHRDPVTTLYLTALNASIDTAEERTAAFENRIPTEAWGMLLFIGFAATVVIGINEGSHSSVLKIMLPIIIAGALALTLDVDSPRYGLIRLTQPSMDRVEHQILADGR